jgi:hypothetical protein
LKPTWDAQAPPQQPVASRARSESGNGGLSSRSATPAEDRGGMLTITKDHVTAGVRKNGEVVRAPIKPEADIQAIEKDIIRMLTEVTRSTPTGK